MRQHYESTALDQSKKLESLQEIQSRVDVAERAKIEADHAREKAERRAEKASGLTRTLQATLSAERSMSEGLNTKVKKLREEVERAEKERKVKEDEVRGLEETVRDLMFTLEAGVKIQSAGGGADVGEGGQLVVVPGKDEGKGKKKAKR